METEGYHNGPSLNEDSIQESTDLVETSDQHGLPPERRGSDTSNRLVNPTPFNGDTPTSSSSRPNIKRKRRSSPAPLPPGPLFSSINHCRQGSTSPLNSPSRRTHRRGQLSRSSLRDGTTLYGDGKGTNGDAYPDGLHDVDVSDYSTEGPGQRVGYGDMTAIDWIFEYTKERQRLKALRSRTTGLLGYFRQLLDASQIWSVLIATGLAAGIITASIDVASDWLGDLKTGYCQNGRDGGRFYLNRGFCCWGYEGQYD